MPLSLFAPLSWLQIYQIDTSDLATSVERGCTSAYQACAMQSIVHSACSWKTQWRKAQQMQPVWKGVATCAAACQPCALQLKWHSGEKLTKCNQCGKGLQRAPLLANHVHCSWKDTVGKSSTNATSVERGYQPHAALWQLHFSRCLLLCVWNVRDGRVCPRSQVYALPCLPYAHKANCMIAKSSVCRHAYRMPCPGQIWMTNEQGLNGSSVHA